MSDLVEVKTIGEVERIVHASGLWDGTGPVEFSDDGHTWTEAWAPTIETVKNRVDQIIGQNVIVGHPTYARVTVYRKDVRIPTTVTIRWDEQVPAENEEWADKWHRAPMRHFGRTARMVGFRQTFRDLLGNIVLEDEGDTRATEPPAGVSATGPSTTEAAPAARDWAAEFRAAAASKDDPDGKLDAVVKEARAARVFKPNAAGTALDRLWKQLRADLLTAAADSWEPRALDIGDGRPAAAGPPASGQEPHGEPVPELTPEEQIRHAAFFEQEEARPVIRNRADRRAAARGKKGRKR